ncbi:hypothetical protein BIY24_07850 [Halobacteriovorax marinus]|uniref:hypothetical protein n=1 Tax=Halobacteriovorax marinus TaxID=97084 RepID=UPI000BC2D27D|nr:hypothetical protein [Halobacteriovorax marinus]ATH07866.1 hypothetical protein BIY24_07850 [Halobacteriovorax marinus]
MPRRLQTISLILTLALILPIKVSAKSKHIFYKREHETCRLKLWDNFEGDEDLDYKELLLEYLKEKNYQVSTLGESRKIINGDYHLEFTWLRSGSKLFKDCSAEIKMYQSELDRARKSDPIIFEDSKQRSFPRHTPSGKERCKRAIRDATRALPHCILKK